MHKSGNQYSKIKQENSLSSNGFPPSCCKHLCSLSLFLFFSTLPEIAEIALHQFGLLTQRKKASGKVILFGERSSDGDSRGAHAPGSRDRQSEEVEREIVGHLVEARG